MTFTAVVLSKPGTPASRSRKATPVYLSGTVISPVLLLVPACPPVAGIPLRSASE